MTPVPETTKSITMSFSDAIGEMLNGKKVTRVEWNDLEEYGMVKDSFLMIHTKGKDHQWIVSEADMVATDWVIVQVVN